MKMPKLAIGNNLNQIGYPSNMGINSKPKSEIKDILLTKMYANKLMDKVHSDTNCKCTIAGGFARDLYFNKHPRDLDIFIVHEGEEPSFLANAVIYNLAKEIFDFPPTLNQGSNLGDKFTNLKCLYGIDLIIQDRGFLYDQGYIFINDFDANINQFILSNDKPLFVGSEEGKLQFYKSVSANRTNRLIEYAKEVNWL